MADKTEPLIEYLKQCPQLANNPLFFNFIEAKDNNKQLVTIANDKAINKPFVDGTVLKRYSLTIIDYRSVSYQALATLTQGTNTNYTNENIDEYLDVQGIIDWITEQNERRNFPNFGADCIIDTIFTATDNPTLNGVDTSLKPALAKYSITIQVDYLDTSKEIWNSEEE